MDQIPSKVTSIIKRFIDELEKNNIPIKEAILFGSYAKGNYHDWSDIDFALVSNAFEGERIIDLTKINKPMLINRTHEIINVPIVPTPSFQPGCY